MKVRQNRFCSLFEHLLFEGSENIARGQFFNIVQNAGGTLNANTSYDRTFYYEVFPSHQLETGLWLESERMLHATVDETGIETQRSVVKEERRQRYDNRPYGRIVEESMQRAYTVHPYRWPVIGSMDHIDAASEEDYRNFYARYYVPLKMLPCALPEILIQIMQKDSSLNILVPFRKENCPSIVLNPMNHPWHMNCVTSYMTISNYLL
ncbi:MAG: insulinase family protein [Saprospiraceae bacterium]|nr:insulinase family protein [Candidatus Parvibacillus calidus]